MDQQVPQGILDIAILWKTFYKDILEFLNWFKTFNISLAHVYFNKNPYQILSNPFKIEFGASFQVNLYIGYLLFDSSHFPWVLTCWPFDFFIYVKSNLVYCACP